MKHHAECSCGQLTVTTNVEPAGVSVCHCYACQRRSGSAFALQAWFPIGEVEIAGESKEYLRTADSGNQHPFYFCPNCGSTVYYQLGDQPDVIAVAVGAFADKDFPPPTRSVYHTSSGHGWIEIPEHIERRG